MSIDLNHAGITHRGRVSLWDGKARVLCEQAFKPGTFRQHWFRGDDLTCRDCNNAVKAGKTP